MRKKRATSGEQLERLMDTDNIIRRSRYGLPGICINGQTAISIAFRFATARQMTVQEQTALIRHVPVNSSVSIHDFTLHRAKHLKRTRFIRFRQLLSSRMEET
jgi:hypothetical protein